MGLIFDSGRKAELWTRLIRAHRDKLTPEAAESLLALRFDEHDQLRMRQLAERSEAGMLTDVETSELDSYLHVGNVLAIMQSSARQALRRTFQQPSNTL